MYVKNFLPTEIGVANNINLTSGMYKCTGRIWMKPRQLKKNATKIGLFTRFRIYFSQIPYQNQILDQMLVKNRQDYNRKAGLCSVDLNPMGVPIGSGLAFEEKKLLIPC